MMEFIHRMKANVKELALLGAGLGIGDDSDIHVIAL
jgi:hypothetical protein